MFGHFQARWGIQMNPFFRCPSPAINCPPPEIIINLGYFGLDRSPKRPTYIGHDHIQFHARDHIILEAAEIGFTNLTDTVSSYCNSWQVFPSSKQGSLFPLYS